MASPLRIPTLKRDRRAISPITRRILTVNLLAVGLLAAGLLYLGQYRIALIESEHKALLARADVFAAALGEGAVDREGRDILVGVTQQMIRRLRETTGTRALLFNDKGALVVDSRTLPGSGGSVRVETLTPPVSNGGVIDAFLTAYNTFVSSLSGHEDYPVYAERPIRDGRDFTEVARALGGDPAVGVRKFQDSGQLLVSAAVPVRRYKQVLGALLLTKDDREIDEAVHKVQLAVLQAAGVAFGVTILLSIYLAGAIARPIRRLAIAADRIRHSHGRNQNIPDFSNRADEIGDLSLALKDMTEALWLRMDAIESFAADVSHEIKNPLTSLRSAVETATRIQDPEQREKLMGIVLEDVRRLDRLIGDISDASRLDAELSRARMEPFAVMPMIRMLMDAHRPRAEEKGLSLALVAEAGDSVVVEAMGGRLAQVFRNLVSNAVSFSPPGGKVTIRVLRVGRNIRIVVDDEGPGLPKGAEEKIFERFYTQRPEGEKFGEHSGLGLSISQQIVVSHGGDLTAENRRSTSDSPSGARFIVNLPEVRDGR